MMNNTGSLVGNVCFFWTIGPANSKQNASGLHSTPACAACVPRMPLAALPVTGVIAFGSWSGWWWRGADGFDGEGWGKCEVDGSLRFWIVFSKKTCRTCWGILGVRKIVESMENPYSHPFVWRNWMKDLFFCRLHLLFQGTKLPARHSDLQWHLPGTAYLNKPEFLSFPRVGEWFY